MLAVLPDPTSAAEANARIQAIKHRQAEVAACRLRNRPERPTHPTGTPKEIIATVARAHDLSSKDLIGDDDRVHVVVARVAAMRAVWAAHPKLTFKAVVRHFGRRECQPFRESVRATPLPDLGSAVNFGDGVSSEIIEIIARTAADFGVTTGAIVGGDRSKRATDARYAAIHAVRVARPTYSLLRLGRIFDKDHTAILNAFRRMEERGVPQPPARNTAGGA